MISETAMTPLESAIAAVNTQPVATEAALLIQAKCRGLLAGYAQRWATSPYIPIEVEHTISAPLMNPQTGRRSQTFQTAGKLDVVTVLGDQRILFDHKTTGNSVDDPDDAYWKILVVEAQASHYMLLKWLLGEKLDGAIWDVIKRPGIAPKKISKADLTAILETHIYCGRTVSPETMARLAAGNDRENLELYEARLAEDCSVLRPEWYFQRRSVPRLDAELLDYAGELWDSAQMVMESRRLRRWPKHPGSCMSYGSPCAYLGICSGLDTADSPNWARKPKVHEELPALDGDGRDTLTFSSVRTYQTCPRKFFYRYELGLEKAAAETAETLFFGSMLHVGLEAFWLSLLPNNNNSAPAALEVPTSKVDW
jgi:hypothetical protein